MPSTESSEPGPTLAKLKLETLNRAIAIYLKLAYGGESPPAAVLKRVAWDESADPATLLNAPPFEKVGKSGAGGSPVYALRLGQARYPHMKLQIQPWSGAAGFLLSVNTHDQVLALDPNSPDAPAFRALQAENARLKQAIEQAWDEAGLPIFLRFLRDYLKDQKPAGKP